MTNTGAGWFQLMCTYNEETVLTIMDLYIMWMTRYYG